MKRQDVLCASMAALWDRDVAYVSINEICKRAHASKAAVYRKFKNEDGLLAETHRHYFDNALAPAFDIHESDAPFRLTLDNLVKLFLSDTASGDFPRGCLFVKMRENQRLKSQVPTDRLAIYIDAQISSAMAREAHHDPTEHTKSILIDAFEHLS